MTVPITASSIALQVDDGIATVTLNRPERLNAIDETANDQLIDILRRIDRDPVIRSVVLTGAGPAFCAGGDIKALESERSESTPAIFTRGHHLVTAFLAVEKPIVAMVNGAAIGLGATIALLCDVVIASEDAKIGDTHVPVGLVAGDGGAVLWPLLIGPHRAKELLMTGDLVTGARAAELGLINRAVPGAELRHTVYALARRLADLPPYAVRGTKASVNRLIGMVAGHILDTSLAWERVSMMSEDHREAVEAFAKRRSTR